MFKIINLKKVNNYPFDVLDSAENTPLKTHTLCVKQLRN